MQYFTSSFILALIRWCEKKSTAAAAGEKYKKEKERRAGTFIIGRSHRKNGESDTTHTTAAIPSHIHTHSKRANNIVYVVCPYGGWVAALSLPRAMVFKTSREGAKYIYYAHDVDAVAQNIESVACCICCVPRYLCTTGDDAEEETDAAHCEKKKETTLFVYSA